MSSHPSRDVTETLTLAKTASYLLEECRIVLPGIQVLFGFQLATVFTNRFATALSASEQQLYLVSIALVAVAIGLIMTPAAYQRQAEPQEVSERFVRISTVLLLASMPLLAVAICIDFYLVARIVLGSSIGVALMSAGLLAVFAGLWFVLPRIARHRRNAGARSAR